LSCADNIAAPVNTPVPPLFVPLTVTVLESVIIAQWDSSLSVLPVARVNSQPRRSISRDFSLADHTLPTRPEPAWQKIAQSPLNDTTQPVDSEEEGRSPTTDRRWLIESLPHCCHVSQQNSTDLDFLSFFFNPPFSFDFLRSSNHVFQFGKFSIMSVKITTVVQRKILKLILCIYVGDIWRLGQRASY